MDFIIQYKLLISFMDLSTVARSHHCFPDKPCKNFAKSQKICCPKKLSVFSKKQVKRKTKMFQPKIGGLFTVPFEVFCRIFGHLAVYVVFT